MNQLFKTIGYCMAAIALLTSCTADKKQIPLENRFAVLSFNLLQGGHDAGNVGFPNSRFDGSRFDDLARVISASQAAIVGVQEDTPTDSLRMALGSEWNRCYTIYSKFTLSPLETNGDYLNACRVHLPNGDSLVLVNCHWQPSGGYGPGLVQQKMLDDKVTADPKRFAREILEATRQMAEGPRGYQGTVDLIQPYIKAHEKVILVGDFNEPSHLDWTSRFAKQGMDRWVTNPTETPLRFAIEWSGSKALSDIGLSDAYRTVYPDEVAKPGNTWTPPYSTETPGRQAYGDQVLDRIDRIYFTRSSLNCKSAALVTGAEGNGEVRLNADWPSDHWAVLAEFELH